MIQTPQIYQYYLDNVEAKRDEFKKEITKLENEKKVLFKSLKKCEYFINTFTNITIDELDNVDNDFVFKSKVNVMLNVNTSFEEIENNINKYVSLSREIAKRKATLEKDGFIPLKTQSKFNFILKEYNKLMIEKVVKDNMRFHLGPAGCIRVRRRKRTKLSPNWYESNKNKARIIAEGKTPYKVIDEDEEGNPITNGGVPWLVYHTGDHYPYFYWDRKDIDSSTKAFLKTGMYDVMSYVPTKGKSGIVSYLNNYVKEHPEKLNEYSK
jgi:hypothetical protein